MAATVYDIAAAAGVSRTTVLRALWNKGKISPSTKARVLKAAEELNYRPNRIARSLVTGKSSFVGVMAGPIDGARFQSYISTIHEILRSNGYSMLMHIVTGDQETDEECVEEMISNKVPGVIALPSAIGADTHLYQRLLDAGIPVIIMDRSLEDLETCQVVANQYMVGRLPTEYLISLGHRRIANLAMPTSHLMGRQRMQGFRDAMQKASLRVDESLIFEVGFYRDAGEMAMKQLLEMKDLPTAVISRNDWVAVGAMDAIIQAGLSVPSDISITGVSNAPNSDMFKIPLTTLTHPTVEMASRAAKHLVDILAGNTVESGIEEVDIQMVIRDSCASPKMAYSI